MNASKFLKSLNHHDQVFEIGIDYDYEYTEEQLINFSERYHERKLKILRLKTSINSYSEEEISKAYEKGFNDGVNSASTDILNSL